MAVPPTYLDSLHWRLPALLSMHVAANSFETWLNLICSSTRAVNILGYGNFGFTLVAVTGGRFVQFR